MTGAPPTEVTLLAAATRDLPACVVAILLLFVLVCTLLLIVAVFGFGADPPPESPAEIAVGTLLIAAVALALIGLRARRLTRVLAEPESVAAAVLGGLAFQLYFQLRVRYRAGGEDVERTLWLPNTGRARALLAAELVHLALAPSGAPVIRELHAA